MAKVAKTKPRADIPVELRRPKKSSSNGSDDDMPKTGTKSKSAAKGRGDGKKKKGTSDAPHVLEEIRWQAADPNAPKRGLSAYMFFANDQRDTVREENPGISFGQVGKVLGDRWKALSEKQRAPYEAKAAFITSLSSIKILP